MDDVDRRILAALQQDGRLTITELAQRVRLSLSPCHRRLRALERSGAITAYRAELDATALGFTFEALVFVTMRDSERDTPRSNEQSRTSPTSCRRSGFSEIPTTCCASSPATCAPFRRFTTTASPPSPAYNGSVQPSS